MESYRIWGVGIGAPHFSKLPSSTMTSASVPIVVDGNILRIFDIGAGGFNISGREVFGGKGLIVWRFLKGWVPLQCLAIKIVL